MSGDLVTKLLNLTWLSMELRASRAIYISAVDAYQPSAALYNIYAKLLHAYRLAKRDLNNVR